jgi:hypothetical protein
VWAIECEVPQKTGGMKSVGTPTLSHTNSSSPLQKDDIENTLRMENVMVGRNQWIVEDNVVTPITIVRLILGHRIGSGKVPDNIWSCGLIFKR